MGLLEICSHNSYWRGLDYFENKRVKTLKQINRYELNPWYQIIKVFRNCDTFVTHVGVIYKRLLLEVLYA